MTVGSTSLVLVVPASLPANSLQELIAYAKANPGQLNVGFGQGPCRISSAKPSSRRPGTNIASIPYRGGAQAMTDMLGERIHMNFGGGRDAPSVDPRGRIKALAVTSPKRGSDLPDAPTMIENGLPGLTTVTYYGFLGLAATPVDVVARINAEVNECLKSAELRASMVKVGFEPTGGSPQDFAALIAEQLQHWALIK